MRFLRGRLPRPVAHAFSDTVTVVAGSVVALVILLALFAPLLTPYDPAEQDAVRSLENPSWSHPFGTDQFGRDILTRILYGARISLMIGFGAVAVALVAGLVLGILSGYYRSVFDVVIMRSIDVALAFPLIIFATLVVVVLGSSAVTVIFAVGISLVPLFTRLARSVVLSLREQEFFEAAVSVGCSDARMMRHHVLPHVFPLLFVQATTAIGLAILSGAALSFIGIGVQPPTADWGRMVSEFAPLVFVHPYLSLYPGLAIAMTAVACNLLGDGLLRAFDPTASRVVA